MLRGLVLKRLEDLQKEPSLCFVGYIGRLKMCTYALRVLWKKWTVLCCSREAVGRDGLGKMKLSLHALLAYLLSGSH